MSYWLGYVVIENGEANMAADYHGYAFLGSVADGPDAILARVAEFGTWPFPEAGIGPFEGVVLTDLDRRVLATYNYDADHGGRHLLLPQLRRAWPGFDVRWAYGGADDIDTYVGVTPGRVEAPVEGWCPYETCGAPYDEEFFLLTIDDAGYALAECGSGGLLAGPDEAATLPDVWRIENLTEWWHRDQPVPLPTMGAHLDTAVRTVTAWTAHTVEGLAEAGKAWPGWRWVFEYDRYNRHYARCDELVRMFLPEPLPGDGWPPLV